MSNIESRRIPISFLTMIIRVLYKSFRLRDANGILVEFKNGEETML